VPAARNGADPVPGAVDVASLIAEVPEVAVAEPPAEGELPGETTP